MPSIRQTWIIVGVLILGAIIPAILMQGEKTDLLLIFISLASMGVACTVLVRDGRRRWRQKLTTAQDRLQEVEGNYHSMFDNMLAAYALHEVVRDANGQPADYRFLDANPAFERLTGLKRDVVLAKTMRQIMPATEESWIQTYGQVVRTQKPLHFERYSEAFRRSFEVYAYSPRPGQVAAFFTDVTDRRRAEERLIEAQKLDALGTLAGGLAHEFNNILTSISGYAELLRRHPQLDGEARDDIRIILEETERAAGLVRQLTDFSHKQPLQRRALDLNQLLRDKTSVLRPLIGENIHLRLDLAADLPLIMADPDKMTQIFIELATNARRAMPDSGTLTIRTEAATATTAHVDSPPVLQETASDTSTITITAGAFLARLIVSDTGLGMDRQHLSHLFDPFFSTRRPGAGLGLPAVYGIVRRHGGVIRVESDPGKGTVFTIDLPAMTSGGAPNG